MRIYKRKGCSIIKKYRKSESNDKKERKMRRKKRFCCLFREFSSVFFFNNSLVEIKYKYRIFELSSIITTIIFFENDFILDTSNFLLLFFIYK